MDVLNTTGGGVDPDAILFGILMGAIAFIGACTTYERVIERHWFLGLVAFIFTAIATVMAYAMFYVEVPVRHEVTLRPGYVIDAAKYEVIERRGKIYVIEEREAAE